MAEKKVTFEQSMARLEEIVNSWSRVTLRWRTRWPSLKKGPD